MHSNLLVQKKPLLCATAWSNRFLDKYTVRPTVKVEGKPITRNRTVAFRRQGTLCWAARGGGNLAKQGDHAVRGMPDTTASAESSPWQTSATRLDGASIVWSVATGAWQLIIRPLEAAIVTCQTAAGNGQSAVGSAVVAAAAVRGINRLGVEVRWYAQRSRLRRTFTLADLG